MSKTFENLGAYRRFTQRRCEVHAVATPQAGGGAAGDAEGLVIGFATKGGFLVFAAPLAVRALVGAQGSDGAGGAGGIVGPGEAVAGDDAFQRFDPGLKRELADLDLLLGLVCQNPGGFGLDTLFGVEDREEATCQHDQERGGKRESPAADVGLQGCE